VIGADEKTATRRAVRARRRLRSVWATGRFSISRNAFLEESRFDAVCGRFGPATLATDGREVEVVHLRVIDFDLARIAEEAMRRVVVEDA